MAPRLSQIPLAQRAKVGKAPYTSVRLSLPSIAKQLTFIKPDINDPVSRHMGLRQPLPYEPQMGGVGKEAAILWKHHAGTFTALKVDFLNHHPGVDYGLEKLEDVLKRSLGQVHPIG